MRQQPTRAKRALAVVSIGGRRFRVKNLPSNRAPRIPTETVAPTASARALVPSASEQRRLSVAARLARRRIPEVPVRLGGGDAPSRAALKESVLDQERLRPFPQRGRIPLHCRRHGVPAKPPATAPPRVSSAHSRVPVRASQR